jgi:hypothetical protein
MDASEAGRALPGLRAPRAAPRITKSMRVSSSDLRLDRLYVVYPGTRRYALDERIECVPLGAIHELAA